MRQSHMDKVHKELKKHAGRDRKYRDHDDRDPDAENNGEATMHRLSEKRKSARKLEDSTLASYDDKDASKDEFKFCEKVKERLHNADDYQSFLKGRQHLW